MEILRAADHAERLNYAIHRGPNAGIAKANAVWGPILVRMQSLPRECCSCDAAFRLPSHREFFDTTYGPLKAQPSDAHRPEESWRHAVRQPASGDRVSHQTEYHRRIWLVHSDPPCPRDTQPVPSRDGAATLADISANSHFLLGGQEIIWT